MVLITGWGGGTAGRSGGPGKTIRLGAVEASIRKNPGTDGRPNFSATFKRGYKDGEVWKDSDAYGQDHLPLLAKAADLAHTAILTEPVGILLWRDLQPSLLLFIRQYSKLAR